MLNMFWMLVHPSSGACDLFVALFHGVYCSGSMCVGVMVWFGCMACIRIPHHPSQTTAKHQHTLYQTNTTHEITQQISHKLLRMDVLKFETCWALNNEIIKQLTSSWSIFIQPTTSLHWALLWAIEFTGLYEIGNPTKKEQQLVSYEIMTLYLLICIKWKLEDDMEYRNS